ncbi:unnamed protein product [Acanthoscelides obtectus]|nr:unnamed protein product [Acanthoscelides obtectus]CAK1655649.1 Protein scarlet [Acanthoscelides obtectus]
MIINGRKIDDYMKYLSGYMHQEDMFIPYLTVLEHMTIMANLKLDRRLTRDDKRQKILNILTELGLLKCLHSKIGGTDQNKALSGGEKKRLAFATEILIDPPLLFCDEPTTGLDSYSAQKLVGIMSKMASERTTIVCTIHQPSMDIFSMFTQLILIADGRTAYIGATSKAIEFFQNLGYTCPSTYSPADYFIKILASPPGQEDSSRQTIKRICDQYAVSDYAKEIDVVVQYEFHMGRAVVPRRFELRSNFKEIHWHSKLYWLVYRWTLEVMRNPTIELTRVLQRVGTAILIGFCYFGTNPYTQNGVQSVQGVIFMLVTENTFHPMYSVLSEFPENTPIFIREYKSGLYHPATYYLSRILSMLPGFILEPVIFISLAYWLTGLQRTFDAFALTTTVIILTMNVASACGIMFSNAFESVPTALAYLVPFDYILMITSGIFIKLSTLTNVFDYLKYLSWFMYSTESLSIVQWKGITNITCENQQQGLPCLKDGTEVLEKYNFTQDNLARDMINMIFLMIAFYLLGYLFLCYRTKRK